jgi:hypothetical protein
MDPRPGIVIWDMGFGIDKMALGPDTRVRKARLVRGSTLPFPHETEHDEHTSHNAHHLAALFYPFAVEPMMSLTVWAAVGAPGYQLEKGGQLGTSFFFSFLLFFFCLW